MENQSVSDPANSSSTRAHSFQTFGQYSQFLRAAVADEESLQMGESLQSMASHTEAVVAALRAQPVIPSFVGRGLLALLDDVRVHRSLLQELGADWQMSYEFKSHFAALNHFRALLTQWVGAVASPARTVPTDVDFELVAWRVLGAGALLLDVYEQSVRTSAQSAANAKPPSAIARLRASARSVWGRLLTVLHLSP
jgi:hypothetical protein